MRILRKSLKGVKMIKKENKNDFFEIGKTINNVSLMGNLYGRLAELKDLKIHIQTRINEIEKQIKENNPLNKQKGAKMQIDHKKVNTLKSFFGVKLRGNETFDELLQIEKDNQERIKRDNENIKRVDAQTRRYFKCRQN